MNQIIMFGLVFAAGTATAWGQERISVNRLDATCGPCLGGSGTIDINQAATGSNSIQINTSNALSACTKRIRVYPHPDDFITTVKSLSINGGSTCEPFQIILGESFFINPDVPPQKVDANWRGMSLSTSAPDSVFYGGCTGNLIGTITGVNKIARFDCEGSVTRNINAIEGINGRGVVLRAGSFTDTCTVTIGKIETIVSDGDLRADVIANLVTGSIVAGGGQGPGVIQATKLNGSVTFGGPLNRVVSTGAGAEVLGQISANAFGTTGSDLTSLDAKVLKANAAITTDVRSPIEIREQWEGETRRISIGRSLSERTDPTEALPVGNRMIILHDTDTLDGETSNPLTNQIIINANNNTPTQDLNGDGFINTADFWRGDVSIDFPGQSNLGSDRFAPALDETLIGPDQPAPFQAPYYKALSHTFGGGAVGLAPFNFHQFTGPMPADPADLDCNPFHTQTIFVGNCEGDLPTLREVVIDHYGPVFASGTGDHYRVEFRPDYFPSDWENVTHLFQVDETQTATTNGGANRKVVLKTVSSAGIQASGYFRFRPLANKVKCTNVSGIPDVAYDSNIVSGDLGNTSSGSQYDWYQFRMRLRVCRQTEMIIFENEQVNAADITAWIDQPFEVNMDGQVCSQDLADMLAAYNAQ